MRSGTGSGVMQHQDMVVLHRLYLITTQNQQENLTCTIKKILAKIMSLTKILLVALLGFTTTLVPVVAQNNIFHGTSVVLYPNTTSKYPGDSTFVGANFYCYFTPVGYLSFGWYVILVEKNISHF